MPFPDGKLDLKHLANEIEAAARPARDLDLKIAASLSAYRPTPADVPAYTTRFEDAQGLVPPGCRIEVGNFARAGLWEAKVYLVETDPPRWIVESGTGASVVLALAAAALRAIRRAETLGQTAV